MDNTALVTAIATLVAAGMYLYVGWRLFQRPVSPESRLPAAQFSLFWAALGVGTIATAVESLVAAFQTPSLALVITVTDINILLICALLWGLVSYLAYLYTGRRVALPLAVVYGILYVLLLYIITASQPDMVTVNSGVVGVHYATFVNGPILAVLLILLILPEFIASFAYFTLVFRTKDPTIRYRVTLVSWSLIAWFGLSFLNIGARLGGGLGAQIVGQGIGVIIAVVVLLAFFPTAGIRSRFGVSAVAAH
ncbi:MAG TPA: hypothetical protein VJQ43_06535 [Thermoplasmata archaeon]|nr:hypothetical protein [Thermoplasmata archaeon]